jgi:hypothetical protein
MRLLHITSGGNQDDQIFFNGNDRGEKLFYKFNAFGDFAGSIVLD